MKAKYFHNEPDGVEFHETAEQAKAKAEEALQFFADEAASDGWHEETECICWGQVIETTTEVSRTKAEHGSQFDEIIDYKLLPVAAEQSDAEARLEEANKMLVQIIKDSHDKILLWSDVRLGLYEAVKAYLVKAGKIKEGK